MLHVAAKKAGKPGDEASHTQQPVPCTLTHPHCLTHQSPAEPEHQQEARIEEDHQ